MSAQEIIIALDPGRKKCGYAIVDSSLKVWQKEVLATERLLDKIKEDLELYTIDKIILGNGTYFQTIQETLKEHFPHLNIVIREERYSTLQARKRYFTENPPRLLGRLIPVSLRVPPIPYDDWVAVILAEGYFQNKA